MQLVRMALKQHLRDARRAPEVPVDLEGRMGVEQVREGVAGQGLDEHPVRVVAVEQPGPEGDLPGLAPARPPIAAEDQGLARGGEEFGRVAPSDLRARVQAVQVGYVPVLVGRIVDVLQPLLKLTVAADLIGCDARPRSAQCGREVGIDSEEVGRGGGVREQAADDLVVHRRPCHQSAVLRGVGGGADQPAGVGVLDQGIEEELGRALHDRVSLIGQPTREAATLPELIAEPRASGLPDPVVRPVDGSGPSPDVGIVMQNPPACPVVRPGGLAARFGDLGE